MSTYSQEKAMGKRFICSQGLMSFRSVPAIIISNAHGDINEDGDILSLPLCKREEIYEFSKSYTDKLLVTEDNGRTWVISPSIFPSSSLCAVFGFETEPKALARLIKKCGTEGMFEFSRYCEAAPARISKRILDMTDGFSRFCREIKQCFYNMDRLKGVEDLSRQRELLLGQCHRISLFTGCPVEVEMTEEDFSNTDLSLFTAFLLTMLTSARKNAADRTARLSISGKAGSALVKVSFYSDALLCISREMLEWKGIAADRCMAFYPTEDNGAVTVEFHPHRYDLSAILGIKQKDTPFCRENPFDWKN